MIKITQTIELPDPVPGAVYTTEQIHLMTEHKLWKSDWVVTVHFSTGQTRTAFLMDGLFVEPHSGRQYQLNNLAPITTVELKGRYLQISTPLAAHIYKYVRDWANEWGIQCPGYVHNKIQEIIDAYGKSQI